MKRLIFAATGLAVAYLILSPWPWGLVLAVLLAVLVAAGCLRSAR